MSDFGTPFLEGPWDFPDFDPHSTAAEIAPARHVVAVSTAVVAGPTRTAYTTVRVKFSAPATPGSTVATGYEMSLALEDFLKEKFGEWLGADMDYEVYVQVNIR